MGKKQVVVVLELEQTLVVVVAVAVAVVESKVVVDAQFANIVKGCYCCLQEVMCSFQWATWKRFVCWLQLLMRRQMTRIPLLPVELRLL